MRFIDTNVLLYSISTDASESQKRSIAVDILAHDDCALSVQVLQEFYVQATRQTRSDRLVHADAVALVRTWTRFPVQDATLAIVNAALNIRAAHGFSYWDCAILAAARALGCRELYSEDMANGRVVDGVEIKNPFL